MNSMVWRSGGLQIGLQIGNCAMQSEGIGCMGWGIGFQAYPPKCNPVKSFICNCQAKCQVKHARIARSADYGPWSLRLSGFAVYGYADCTAAEK